MERVVGRFGTNLIRPNGRKCPPPGYSWEGQPHLQFVADLPLESPFHIRPGSKRFQGVGDAEVPSLFPLRFHRLKDCPRMATMRFLVPPSNSLSGGLGSGESPCHRPPQPTVSKCAGWRKCRSQLKFSGGLPINYRRGDSTTFLTNPPPLTLAIRATLMACITDSTRRPRRR